MDTKPWKPQPGQGRSWFTTATVYPAGFKKTTFNRHIHSAYVLISAFTRFIHLVLFKDRPSGPEFAAFRSAVAPELLGSDGMDFFEEGVKIGGIIYPYGI